MWKYYNSSILTWIGYGIYWSVMIVALHVMFTSSSSPSFDSSSAIQEHISKIQGKEQIDRMVKMSQLPKIGECWKEALRGMEVSCKDLDGETQSRLALKFTSCYNQMTKFSSDVICEDTDLLVGCMEALDSNGQNTFRDFFLQTQHMCFYIQSEIWREATDRSVNMLTTTASFVSSNLKDSEERQKRILESQEHSKKIQSGLMKDQNALFNVVVRLKDIFNEFRVSVEDHRMIFAEIFEKLTRTQKLVSWIQGEMSLLDMMGFYFISLIFGFIASAPQRTRKARFWLVCLGIISLGSERYLYNYLDQKDNYAPEQIQECIWYMRRVAAGFGVLIIIWSAASYRDYQALNNNMLADLHGRMEVLMEFMNELSKSGGQVPAKFLTEPKRGEMDDDIAKPEKDDEVLDDISEVSSNNTTFSNYTDDSESMTNEVGDISEEIDSAEVEVNDLQTRPIFERFFGSNLSQNDENISTGNISATTSTPNTFHHSYNLRQRNTNSRENSILRTEGPTAFACTIKKSRKQNQAKFNVEDRSHVSNYFSSDDEF